MTATKDQEREAIDRIREIVRGLGEDSCVGAAMKGVLEMAECNIENDASDSYADITESRNENIIRLTEDVICLTEQRDELQRSLDAESKEALRLRSKMEEFAELSGKHAKQIDFYQAEITAQNNELYSLKARLCEFFLKQEREQSDDTKKADCGWAN